MIYTKEASFSYPILSNNTNYYVHNLFYLELEDIIENSRSYTIKFNIEIESDFIKNLIEKNKARMILILSSKDNRIFYLEKNQKSLTVTKNRVSFSDKTRFQIHLQAIENIDFFNCSELSHFYNSFKNQITINKNSLIGFSNVATVRNTGKETIQLFKIRIDNDLKSDFNVQYDSDSIILVFKDERFRLENRLSNLNLMNLYLYQGLSRGIQRFIVNNKDDHEETLYLENIDTSSLDNLDLTLFDLFEQKGFEEVNNDNIDEIISSIAPEIISRFTESVARLSENGN